MLKTRFDRTFVSLITLLFLLVLSCALFSLNFTREVGRVSALWPANAIVLLFLLKDSNAVRCGIYLVCGLIANALARLSISDDYVLVLSLSLVNSFEIIIVAAWLRFFLPHSFDINHYRDLVFFGLGCCLAPFCSGALASMLLYSSGQAHFLDSWLIWFLSHSLGFAIFTPMLLILHAGDIERLLAPGRRFKTGLIVLVNLLVLSIVFYQSSYPILFLPFASLVCSAFYLEIAGASICLVLTAMVAVYATTHEHGPLALVHGSLTQRLLIMELFLAVTILMTLPIASIVAQRLRLQVSYLKAKQDAEQASRAKSDFLTAMSHELRTPLNSILGFAQLLTLDEHNSLNEKEKTYVNYILNGGDYLLKLINDVLDLARIEAGRIHLALRSVDCKDAIKSLITTLRPLAEKNNVTIETEFNDSVPALEADPDRLMQVLINLGSNAIKYNKSGGNVKISVMPHDSMVRITVADNGPGIPAHKQSELFEPFNRLGAEKSTIEGTGIGLAIVKKLIEAMHGQIGFMSNKDRTEFWIELKNATPLYKIDSNFEEAIPLQPQKLNASILYIEDNPANCVLMTQMLKDFLGIDVMVAMTLHDGLTMARRHKPDVIITDIHLPDGTGFDFLKTLRAEPALEATPVIAVTADAMEVTRDKIKQAGFDASYTKPFQVANVIQTIVKLCTAKS